MKYLRLFEEEIIEALNDHLVGHRGFAEHAFVYFATDIGSKGVEAFALIEGDPEEREAVFLRIFEREMEQHIDTYLKKTRGFKEDSLIRFVTPLNKSRGGIQALVMLPEKEAESDAARDVLDGEGDVTDRGAALKRGGRK